MGTIGLPEMLGIFVIALLLFGPKKLPELGRTLGKAISEFRRASNELKSTFESHLHELEKETRLEDTRPSELSTTSYSSTSYPYEHDYGQYNSDYSSTYGNESDPYSYSSPAAEVKPEAEKEHQELAAASDEHSPVPGTVARSNGNYRTEPGSIATEEDHSA